jgi:hypothetical protein
VLSPCRDPFVGRPSPTRDVVINYVTEKTLLVYHLIVAACAFVVSRDNRASYDETQIT